jgi:hypothetical protein
VRACSHARAHAPAPREAWRASDTRASWHPDRVGLLVAILTLVLLVLVAFVISAPVRRVRRGGKRPAAALAGGASGEEQASANGHLFEEDARAARTRQELEAAREAKYREIRDAELDYRTGKLSHEDYEAIDTDLRAEAIEILNRLEQLRPRDA